MKRTLFDPTSKDKTNSPIKVVTYENKGLTKDRKLASKKIARVDQKITIQGSADELFSFMEKIVKVKPRTKTKRERRRSKAGDRKTNNSVASK